MFTDRAARLAGLAGALAGWPPDAFWRATPEELGGVIAALAGGEEAAAPVDLDRLREMWPDG